MADTAEGDINDLRREHKIINTLISLQSPNVDAKIQGSQNH